MSLVGRGSAVSGSNLPAELFLVPAYNSAVSARTEPSRLVSEEMSIRNSGERRKAYMAKPTSRPSHAEYFSAQHPEFTTAQQTFIMRGLAKHWPKDWAAPSKAALAAVEAALQRHTEDDAGVFSAIKKIGLSS